MADQNTAVRVSFRAGKTLNLLPADSYWLLPVGANW